MGGEEGEGGPLLGRAATASGPGEPSAGGPCSPRGGTIFGKKRYTFGPRPQRISKHMRIDDARHHYLYLLGRGPANLNRI